MCSGYSIPSLGVYTKVVQLLSTKNIANCSLLWKKTKNEKKKELFHILHIIFTPHGRYELSKLTSLPMCGFIAQLVEQCTGNAEVTGSFFGFVLFCFFQASSFQLLKLENLLRWSFFTFKSMKLCQITTNPKTDISGYGAKPNSTLDTSSAQALKWPTWKRGWQWKCF